MLLIKQRFGIPQLYLISRSRLLETEPSRTLKLDLEFTAKMVRNLMQMDENLTDGLPNSMNGLPCTLLKLLSFTNTQSLITAIRR